MFCINCGNQMPEGAKFCGSCGTNVTQEDGVSTDNTRLGNGFDIKEIINEIGTEIISLVKNPINTVKESKNKSNNTYMIFGLLSTILAVLNVYIFKSAVVKTIGGAVASAGLDYMLEGKHTGIIIRLLINNIAIIAIVAGVIFLILNVILKKSSFTYFDGLKVLIAGYSYSTIIVFLGTIISYIYLPLGISLILISIIAYMILVYEGISSFEIIDKSGCLYIVLVVIASIMIIQCMIISNQTSKLIGELKSESMNILGDMFF